MTRIALSLSALLLLGVSAKADDFPPRKPGLWQIDMAMPGGPMPPQQLKMCIDTATDAAMYKMGMNASEGMCSKPNIVRNGSTLTIDSSCKMGETKATTHAVTKFTGETAYHTDVNTKLDPPMAGHAEQTMTQDAKWAGPCPADMVPGDVTMPNGMKMNVKDMLGNKG